VDVLFITLKSTLFMKITVLQYLVCTADDGQSASVLVKEAVKSHLTQ